ncbi:MAG: hypothetical protein AAF363_20155 [Bacteroidota bacterium]
MQRNLLFKITTVIMIYAFTLPTADAQRYKRPKRKSYRSNTEYPEKSIGIEIPFSILSTSVDVPALVTLDDVEDGSGWRTGLGVSYRTKKLGLRLGFFRSEIKFNPNIETRDFLVRENGDLTYAGIYIRAEYSIKYFFIGGGFDFSFANNYEASRDFIENGEVVNSFNDVGDESIAGDFRNILFFTIEAGPKIPIGNLSIKPQVSLGLSSSIADPEEVSVITDGPGFQVVFDEPQNVDIQFVPAIGYGVSLEYNF